ncbi:Voltage-dependent calcium channel subunit alpha-2/delta-4 [Apodemus speciosus]|uniref:Voltage-dependent calcium channel subunit alpha-2/delta-4 n=1 Tax=Apodemus speciosus TaxID=105296 RepID=A0ABQ0EW09_APOSI
MQADYLQHQFWAAVQQCSTAEGPCPKSCEDTDLDCFVIDNNGFILISERPQEIGRLLGEADGALMTQLLSMGVFSRVTMYDYQAMCKAPDHHHSAGESLISAHKHKKQDLLHPCDTEYPVFVHQTAIQEANGIIECGVCRK